MGDVNQHCFLEARIDSERVRVVMAQVPMATLVTLVNATLMAAVLLSVIPTRGVLVWLAAAFVVAAIRLGLWLSYCFVLRRTTNIDDGPGPAVGRA